MSSSTYQNYLNVRDKLITELVMTKREERVVFLTEVMAYAEMHLMREKRFNKRDSIENAWKMGVK